MKYAVIGFVAALSIFVIAKSPGTLTFGFIAGLTAGAVLGVIVKS